MLLGNGNGTFQAQQTVAAGIQPEFVTAADLNGDGKPDLIVANYGSNSVGVLLGNGNGTFQTQQAFATGAGPDSIAMSDFNGDGKTDLAVANRAGASVSVLLGNGNGSFQPQQTYTVGITPQSIAAADVNGDGNTDLAVANSTSGNVSVLLGNGDGTFQAQQTFAINGIVASSPSAVALGDINGDGRADLVVADQANGAAVTLTNALNGSFTGQVYFINTLPPTSSITGLPAFTFTPSFTVNWNGNDIGGPGIAYFNIYVSDNGGPFTLFVSHTTQLSATFNGTLGHTYGFYSVATDLNGISQVIPTAAQMSIAVVLPFNTSVTATHGSTLAPISLDSLDPTPNGPVTYTVTFQDPLDAVRAQYGLTLADGYFNYRGQDEKYLLSNNDSNSAGKGYYVLMPTGKLYAYKPDALNDLAATLAQVPVAATSPSVWYNPALLANNYGAPIVTAGTNPFYDLKIQYGLVNPVTAENTNGANEEYLHSSNNSNAPNGGTYVLMPDNRLYALAGGTLATRKLVADFNLAPYAAAVPTTNTTINQAGGITAAATTLTVASSAGFPTVPFVVRIDSELMQVTQISGTVWTVTRGFDGTTAVTHANGAVVAFGNVYANPSLLTSAVLPIAVGINSTTSTNNGGLLTLTPLAGFDRSVTVIVQSRDLTQHNSNSFTCTVTDVVPSIAAVANKTVNHNSAVQKVQLSVTDPNPDAATRTYAVSVSGYNPLYDLQAQYGLNHADLTGMYNQRGQKEKYFQSSNDSNSAGSNLYVLMPTDKLYAYVPDANNDLKSTLAQPPVANFAAAPYSNTGNVYNTTALLYDALSPAVPTVASNRGPLYDIQTQYGLTIPTNPATFNKSKVYNEKYLQSANGSNAAGGGTYVLLPNDKLYAYNGVSVATTIANAPVVDFSLPQYAAAGNVWAEPNLLTAVHPAFVNNSIFNVQQVYGLTTADQTASFNLRGQSEKYLQSSNGSNPGGSNLYVLMPSDKLYAYVPDSNNDLVATLAQAPVFDFTPYGNVYASPASLYAATGQFSLPIATINATGLITITQGLAFVGTVRITATVSDGAERSSRSFLFTVVDNAPTLSPIANQTVASTAGSKLVAYTATTYNGAKVLPAASVSGYNPLHDVQQLYGLNTAPFKTITKGKLMKSGNGSNPSFGNEYLLSTTDKLYAWQGTISATLAKAPVVDFTSATYAPYGGANVYKTPALLYATTQPAAPNITITFPSAGELLISWPAGFKGTFRTTLFIGDGALETQQSFLVTVD